MMVIAETAHIEGDTACQEMWDHESPWRWYY